jgi:hypothetical protein
MLKKLPLAVVPKRRLHASVYVSPEEGHQRLLYMIDGLLSMQI